MLNEARVEVMDQSLMQREQRGKALEEAAKSIPKEAAPAVLEALKAHHAEAKAAKNGAKAGAALQALINACEAFLADKANDNKTDARKQVQAALAAAAGELEIIRQTNLALDKLSAKGPDWDKDGVWSNPDVPGIKIQKSTNVKVACKEGTEEAQVAQFLAAFRTEAERSDVFAEMARDLTSGEHFDSLTFAFGENSCGFYDSSSTKAVDQSDLEFLPLQPSKVKMPDGNEVTTGVVAGEVMLHVLEERLYMQSQPSTNKDPYQKAHERCLDPASFQNRYRKELGMESDSIIYDSCVHASCKDKKHNHEHHEGGDHEQLADFRAFNADGVVQVSKAIPQAKVDKPDMKVDRDPTAVTYEKFDLNALLEQAWKEVLDALMGQMLRTPVEKLGEVFKDDIASWNDLCALVEPAKDISRSLTAKYHLDPKKWDKIAAAQKSILEECNKARRAFVADRKTNWPNEITSKRATADAAISEYENANKDKPVTDPDGFLLARRKERAGKAINVSKSTANCAMTSAGPILGKTSKEVLESYGKDVLKLKDKEGPKLNEDDTTIWWQMQNKKKVPPTSKEVPASEIGDAQFSAQRALFDNEVKKRNEENGKANAPLRYKAVQDGTPDQGKMYPKAELLKRMQQYPSGSQFQIFLTGAGGEGIEGSSHWIYGEKLGRNLVIEDYQKNKSSTTPRAAYLIADNADLSKEKGPGHATTDQPGYYEQGMFIALVPITPELTAAESSDQFAKPDTKDDKFKQFA